MTPLERHGSYLVKRDDLYTQAGHHGGKVRTCLALAKTAEKGQGLVTAGSRHSPQVAMVAAIAKQLGLRAQCHVPAGDWTPEITQAMDDGAEMIFHRPGHNTVIVARAAEAARAMHWLLIPFGMEHEMAVTLTAAEAAGLPSGHRIVVSVGSGMTLAGILTGQPGAQVLGVIVGADPRRRLARWAPLGWQLRTQLVQAQEAYETRVDARLDGIALDPVYEAKMLPHLRANDIVWLTGHRA